LLELSLVHLARSLPFVFRYGWRHPFITTPRWQQLVKVIPMSDSSRRRVIRVPGCVLGLLLARPAAQAATFTVNSTTDAGERSAESVRDHRRSHT
jgi:hypothetical protein